MSNLDFGKSALIFFSGQSYKHWVSTLYLSYVRLLRCRFGSRNVKFSRLPGWEPNSWGYYGDDGHAYDNGGSGVAYSQTFGCK